MSRIGLEASAKRGRTARSGTSPADVRRVVPEKRPPLPISWEGLMEYIGFIINVVRDVIEYSLKVTFLNFLVSFLYLSAKKEPIQ